MKLQGRIEAAITAATGEAARMASMRPVTGGCINDSRIATLEDGRRYFIKQSPGSTALPGFFEAEFVALSLLGEPGVIRVPQPVTFEEEFIVIEAFEEGERGPDWTEHMGRQLAELHLATRARRYGFERDNYLGTTPQHNDWSEDWVTFWRQQRLGWQLDLFARKAGADDPLLALGERLLARLDALIGEPDEPPVLLHGDLWAGNAAADEHGEPVIFDPASYYGRREAEIGMMRLFGGFGPRCEAAYNEVWPLAAGADARITLYRLYHELNHLNLFGRSYYQTCMTTMESLL